MAQQFIGVYATNESVPSSGDFPKPLGKRKRLWFVWETPEGKYKIQALNAVHQPMAEPRIISGREFEGRFVHEPGCDAVPEGYARLEPAPVNAASASLPDLFLSDTERAAQPHSPFFPMSRPSTDDGTIHADDPNLLMAWAKAEPRPKKRGMDPAKIPFDRLVGEVVESPDEHHDTQAGDVAAANFSEPENVDDAEQVRILRSRFVQALLLLRRGERMESVDILREMLAQPYKPFEGGAQLFSEFGLGLRRLGLIPLALAAHKRALEFAPSDARILFNIARSYHDLDHLAEARDFLGKALAADPDFAVARQFLAFLEAGTDA